MTLGELIEQLKEADPDWIIQDGFGSPHSDRGSYANLAFAPAENVTVGSMLKYAESAVGKIFTGWKGGDFKMGLYTEVYVGEWGSCGEPLSRATIDSMLNMSYLKTEVAALQKVLTAAVQLADQTGWSDPLKEAIQEVSKIRQSRLKRSTVNS